MVYIFHVGKRRNPPPTNVAGGSDWLGSILLNEDLGPVVLGHVHNLEDVSALGRTCSRLWDIAHRDGMRVSSVVVKENEREDVTRAACSLGDMRLIRFAHKRYLPVDDHCATTAAQFGRIDILKFLQDLGCPMGPTVTCRAAHCEQLACLKWLREVVLVPWDRKALRMAAYAGSTKCLEYILDTANLANFHEEGDGGSGLRHCLDDGIDQVARCCSLECLIMLLEHGGELRGEATISLVAGSGNLIMLQWLWLHWEYWSKCAKRWSPHQEVQEVWTEEPLISAVYKGELECLKFLHEKCGHRLDTYKLIGEAIRIGRGVKCLKFLLGIGNPGEVRCVCAVHAQWAMRRGNTDQLDAIVEHGHVFTDKDVDMCNKYGWLNGHYLLINRYRVCGMK
jgi:hypothetical protein